DRGRVRAAEGRRRCHVRKRRPPIQAGDYFHSHRFCTCCRPNRRRPPDRADRRSPRRYYEWQDAPGGKQPYYLTARDGSPALTVAGLWDEWKNRKTEERLKSCAMIITEPNDFVAEVHDRMPVLLTEKQFEPWLSGEVGAEYLKPAPN